VLYVRPPVWRRVYEVRFHDISLVHFFTISLDASPHGHVLSWK
jgi:hypothetical protein